MTRIKTILARLPTVYRHQKGQSLVEFAIVLPLLLGLVLGIVQFGIIFVGQITITSVAREGARSLSYGRSYDAVFKEIVNATDSFFLTVEENNISFTVTYIDDSGEEDTQEFNKTDSFDYDPIYLTPVSVTIPASVEIIVPLLPSVLGEVFNIRADASMRYQVRSR